MPFSPVHLSRMELATEDLLVVTRNGELTDLLKAQSEMGPSATAFANGKPVAVFGFVSIWKGVAEAWLIADSGARHLPVTLTRYGKAAQDIAMISMGLHRLQITVRNTDNRAVKWARAIGYEQECVMRKYGPDQVDYLLMARYK